MDMSNVAAQHYQVNDISPDSISHSVAANHLALQAASTWQAGHYGHHASTHMHYASYYGHGHGHHYGSPAEYQWYLAAQHYQKYGHMMHYQAPHYHMNMVHRQHQHFHQYQAPHPYQYQNQYHGVNGSMNAVQGHMENLSPKAPVTRKPEPIPKTVSISPLFKIPVREFSIRNVVCNFSLPMHIDLHKFATKIWNCVLLPNTTVLTKAMRNPRCHVRIYSSGKVYIVGCKSEEDSRKASRSIARQIQVAMDCKHEKICLQNFRISNILATCKLPFGIMIQEMARKYPKDCEYEPELTVGAVWRSQEPRAVMRIHTTGTISVTGATSEAGVIAAIEKIHPIVTEFRCDPNAEQTEAIVNNRKRTYRNNSLKDVEIDPVLFTKRRRGHRAHAVQVEENEYNDLVECDEFLEDGDFDI